MFFDIIAGNILLSHRINIPFQCYINDSWKNASFILYTKSISPLIIQVHHSYHSVLHHSFMRLRPWHENFRLRACPFPSKYCALVGFGNCAFGYWVANEKFSVDFTPRRMTVRHSLGMCTALAGCPPFTPPWSAFMEFPGRPSRYQRCVFTWRPTAAIISGSAVPLMSHFVIWDPCYTCYGPATAHP